MVKRESLNFLFNAHGHPKEICQQRLTGARRTSRERFSLLIAIFYKKRKIYEVKKNGSKNQIKKNGSEESSYL